MRKYCYILLILLSYSCSSQKKSILNTLKTTTTYTIDSCETNFKCSLSFIPNTKLIIKKDEFGLTYGEFVKSDSILVKYQKKQQKENKAVDNFFTETLYFSIAKNDTKISLKDIDLQKANMALQRECYCKGTAGFFKITKGSLLFDIKKNELTLNTDFDIKNIPHKLRKINKKVTLTD